MQVSESFSSTQNFKKKKRKSRGGIHSPTYFIKKFLVLFLIRVKTITTQAMTHGGKFQPGTFNLLIHSGRSLNKSVIRSVITVNPNKILVTGLIMESCIREYQRVNNQASNTALMLKISFLSVKNVRHQA